MTFTICTALEAKACPCKTKTMSHIISGPNTDLLFGIRSVQSIVQISYSNPVDAVQKTEKSLK